MKCQQSNLNAVWDVLVVDADAGMQEVVRAAAVGTGQVRAAQSVDEAQAEMKRKPADVVVVNLQVNDNGGLGLIERLRATYPACAVIATSRSKRTETCLEAWRAGAADMLVGTVRAEDVRRSVIGVMGKKSGGVEMGKRNRRLRSVCKQLNKARHEIRQQVDLLCNDLVRAYQEMAQQLNATQLAVDYCQMTGNEIEVEGLLRKTMEWVLAKIGPVNAAVYLADANREFALGAYLNMDTEADGALIKALGDTLVKKAAGGGKTLAVEGDPKLMEWFGDEAAELRGKTWLSTGCFAPSGKHECLAVLVVFRKQGEPVDGARGMMEAVAPLLGEKIEQALELYHRMHPRDEEGYEGEGEMTNDE